MAVQGVRQSEHLRQTWWDGVKEVMKSSKNMQSCRKCTEGKVRGQATNPESAGNDR